MAQNGGNDILDEKLHEVAEVAEIAPEKPAELPENKNEDIN